MVAPTELSITAQQGLAARGIPSGVAKEEGFAVASDTDVDVKAFDPIKFADGFILQCHNSNASNGLIFTLYGCADDLATPPDFSTNKWVLLPNSSKTIAADTSDAVTNTDAWRWILIRVKRESAGLNATANFFIRGV